MEVHPYWSSPTTGGLLRSPEEKEEKRIFTFALKMELIFKIHW